jgi:AraC-like DNA-binding protein
MSQLNERARRSSEPEALERHWTVAEIAEIWNLSQDAVRRLFYEEPGVLILGNCARGRKRRYTTLRVPQSVLERVHHRLSPG